MFQIFNPFNPVFHFYNARKRQKTFGFLTFSGGMEIEHWLKWVKYSTLTWEKSGG